jgi:hypothetical protein
VGRGRRRTVLPASRWRDAAPARHSRHNGRPSTSCVVLSRRGGIPVRGDTTLRAAHSDSFCHVVPVAGDAPFRRLLLQRRKKVSLNDPGSAPPSTGSAHRRSALTSRSCFLSLKHGRDPVSPTARPRRTASCQVISYVPATGPTGGAASYRRPLGMRTEGIAWHGWPTPCKRSRSRWRRPQPADCILRPPAGCALPARARDVTAPLWRGEVCDVSGWSRRPFRRPLAPRTSPITDHVVDPTVLPAKRGSVVGGGD